MNYTDMSKYDNFLDEIENQITTQAGLVLVEV